MMGQDGCRVGKEVGGKMAATGARWCWGKMAAMGQDSCHGDKVAVGQDGCRKDKMAAMGQDVCHRGKEVGDKMAATGTRWWWGKMATMG